MRALESTKQKREINQEVSFHLKVYNPVYEFWTETEIPLRKTEPKLLSTKIHPAKCFLLLVVITPLDLCPMLTDHIIINHVETLSYISAQTVCSKTLRRSSWNNIIWAMRSLVNIRSMCVLEYAHFYDDVCSLLSVQCYDYFWNRLVRIQSLGVYLANWFSLLC